VVLTTDAEKARAVGRKAPRDLPQPDELPSTAGKRLGFTDEDVAKPGSDRLVERGRRLTANTRTPIRGEG